METKKFKLSNGKILIQDFGKYRSNLIIINSSEELEWAREDYSKYNLGGGYISTVQGTFFITKKGACAFEIGENGPHTLIRDDWGGHGDRGGNLPVDENENENDGVLYRHSAPSNSGRSGYDYIVVPRDWKKEVSIENF